MSASLKQLKIYQAEIFLRASKSLNVLERPFYFRHIDIFSSSQADEVYEERAAHAKELGLLSLAEKLKELAKEGLWTNGDVNKLEEEKSFLSNLKVTRSKMHLKSEREMIKYQIGQAEEKIKSLEEKRDSLIGLTTDGYANKKANLYLLYSSLFLDRECKVPVFSWEDYDDLDDETISKLFLSFNHFLSKFCQENLKKIALSPSFLNSFFLADNNPYTFYGEPLARLSFYQIEVFSSAKYYKHIIEESNNNIPEDVMSDPEKLMEWFESNKNAQKILSKYDDKDDMNVSLVGATKEDMENLGMVGGKRINLAQEAMKKGSSLNMEDLIRLQGL